MREESPLNQVMAVKASSGVRRVLQAAQRVVQGFVQRAVQRAVQEGSRSARELLCLPSVGAMCERVSSCPGPNQQREDKTTQVALLNPASTILIVNISNSTLIDCVIGGDACAAAVTESQPLMREPELHMHNEPAGINIHSSHLNCVIIGDNNYMHAELPLGCEALDALS